jgi:hypothetical protein
MNGNWPGYHKSMDDLLAASIAHHAAESAVFAAKRSGDGNVSEELMSSLDKASVDLRSASRIYASLHKKVTANKLIIDGLANEPAQRS